MAKDDEKFNFEKIAQVYREERNSATLTRLPLHFYKKITAYIEKLHSNYIEERQKDPASPRTIMLEDELQKSEKRASEIYELRERKIVLLALSVANGGDPNIMPLTVEEKTAFNNLVETLSKNRSQVMVLRKESCESKSFVISDQKTMGKVQKEEKSDEEDIRTKEDNIPINQSETSTEEYPKENPAILILEDIPAFETKERVFNLKKDDTITLPWEYARILCKHGKAKVIQT